MPQDGHNLLHMCASFSRHFVYFCNYYLISQLLRDESIQRDVRDVTLLYLFDLSMLLKA